MFNQEIVIGGWSLSPRILEPFFGPAAHYVDSNELVARVIDDDGALVENWPRVICESIHSSEMVRPYRLIGWSMGAMLAFACARALKPTEIVFLSPTLSFVRRPDYRFGMNPAVLRRMSTSLVADRTGTLSHFQENCGIPGNRVGEFEDDADTTILRKGLSFLQLADLRSFTPPGVPIRILYGEEDRIIPPNASRLFAERCGSPAESVVGGHAFFIHHEVAVRTSLQPRHLG